MIWAERIAAVFVFVVTAAGIYAIVFGLRWIEGAFGLAIFFATAAASLIGLAVLAVRLDMRRYRLPFRQMIRFYSREFGLSSTDDKPPQDRP